MSDDADDLSTRRLVAPIAAERAVRIKEGHLAVVEGPDRGRRFVFKSPGVRVGKSRDNDIVLTDDTVSKHHLSIEDTPWGFLLRDLKSTNGTFLEKNRIREAFLTPGCSIKLGDTTLRFEPPGERIQIPASKEEQFGRVRGKSLKIREIFGVLERVAPTDSTVLIFGETGTGKEVVAQSVHDKSPRAKKPYVVFDCSSVARELMESALFGHREGAFTGATSARKGAFLSADGGTIFIDEIGELPSDLQPKLLRVLEKREVQSLGTDAPQRIDVRVIAATHRNLREMVREGGFRQDLYYRLSVFELSLPSLRERTEDIPVLVSHFLEIAERKDAVLTPEALAKLAAHRWEGNVRELKNVIERALVYAGDGAIEPGHLSLDGGDGPPLSGRKDILSGEKSLEEVEAQVIQATLNKTSWNKTQAAKILGITRRTLLDKIARYNLTPE